MGLSASLQTVALLLRRFGDSDDPNLIGADLAEGPEDSSQVLTLLPSLFGLWIVLVSFTLTGALLRNSAFHPRRSNEWTGIGESDHAIIGFGKRRLAVVTLASGRSRATARGRRDRRRFVAKQPPTFFLKQTTQRLSREQSVSVLPEACTPTRRFPEPDIVARLHGNHSGNRPA